MRPRPKRTSFSSFTIKGVLVGILLILVATPALSEPGNGNSKVVCRKQLSVELRGRLSNKLSKITGWPDIGFNERGVLQIGNAHPVGGSKTARELVAGTINGSRSVVLEDASNRADVAFCRVVRSDWKTTTEAYVVQIDFADFEKLMGDRRALEAFNVGWGLLHELDHVANDSADTDTIGETGECELHINQMRRECDLPQRAEYFFTLLPLPGSVDLKTRFVRLPFVTQLSLKNRKRYWLIWDADLVGGIDTKQEIAILR